MPSGIVVAINGPLINFVGGLLIGIFLLLGECKCKLLSCALFLWVKDHAQFVNEHILRLIYKQNVFALVKFLLVIIVAVFQ